MAFMLEPRLSKEFHRKIMELTLALYRVTDFFPQGEVLRRQLREKANEIFASVNEYGSMGNPEEEVREMLGGIRSIIGLLRIARAMNFAKPINFEILEREYSWAESFFERETEFLKFEKIVRPEKKIAPENILSDKPGKKETKDFLPIIRKGKNNPVDNGEKSVSMGQTVMSDREARKTTNARQKTIIEHLKQHSQVKISDLYSFFNGISSKTIQRDLHYLVSKNVLKKEGEKRWTIYSLSDTKV